MSAVAVIPARYASTRFPAKPLARQTGKFLIQHVYERTARATGIDRVIVATDDERIREAVQSFGGDCVMTRPDHSCGTDRVAQVARSLDCEIVVNVQGDEPEIDPQAIETLLPLVRHGRFRVATLACSFAALARQGITINPADPDCVKVVCARGRALYFSRSLVPYARHAEAADSGPLLHLGIYAYRREFLLHLTALERTPLERIEGLEQLRVLEHGFTMAVGLVARAAVGIDTPADYAAFVDRYNQCLSGVGTGASGGPGPASLGT